MISFLLNGADVAQSVERGLSKSNVARSNRVIRYEATIIPRV
jgi:hypothetical protein